MRNYTSTVAPAKSILKIETLLAKAGVTNISKSFEDGKVSGIKFRLEHNNSAIFFEMPVRIDRYVATLAKNHKGRLTDVARRNIIAQAERTVWKTTAEWIEIQLDMIAQEQVSSLEVFLAYAINPHTGVSVMKKLESTQFKLLTE
jgi:hypothetical protein